MDEVLRVPAAHAGPEEERLAVCLCAKPHTSVATAAACRSRMLTVVYYHHQQRRDDAEDPLPQIPTRRRFFAKVRVRTSWWLHCSGTRYPNHPERYGLVHD